MYLAVTLFGKFGSQHICDDLYVIIIMHPVSLNKL